MTCGSRHALLVSSPSFLSLSLSLFALFPCLGTSVAQKDPEQNKSQPVVAPPRCEPRSPRCLFTNQLSPGKQRSSAQRRGADKEQRGELYVSSVVCFSRTLVGSTRCVEYSVPPQTTCLYTYTAVERARGGCESCHFLCSVGGVHLYLDGPRCLLGLNDG